MSTPFPDHTNTAGRNLAGKKLYDLIRSGEADSDAGLIAVKSYLAQKPDLNETFLHAASGGLVYNDTCLRQAVAQGHHEIVELLLAAGASTEFKDHTQRTPLMIAAQNGDAVMTGLLLKAKADPEACDGKGYNALMMAVLGGSETVVALILSRGKVDIDAQAKNLETALHIAARYGEEAIAHRIATAGARLDLRNEEFETPFETALHHSKTKTAALLEEVAEDRQTRSLQTIREWCDTGIPPEKSLKIIPKVRIKTKGP